MRKRKSPFSFTYRVYVTLRGGHAEHCYYWADVGIFSSKSAAECYIEEVLKKTRQWDDSRMEAEIEKCDAPPITLTQEELDARLHDLNHVVLM